jgi:hypothetical protein
VDLEGKCTDKQQSRDGSIMDFEVKGGGLIVVNVHEAELFEVGETYCFKVAKKQ